jgi:hypothetical protein
VIAIEIGQSVDQVAHRFRDVVVLDDVGMRSVPADAARRFFTTRAEWKARHEEKARKRTEELARKTAKPAVVGAPAQEGATPFESMMAAEATSGTYTTPKAEFGPGWGNPTRELMDEQFAQGQKELAERRARAKERAAQRMKEDLQ